jgi:glycosyltransferase involved in cell wall biosynthesis
VENKLLSILMVAYNHELYVREALESIIAQSYKDWEVVVVDDGSIDHTRDIVNEYCKRWGSRIRLYTHRENGNRGIAASYERGLNECLGKYVGFLEGDDLWSPRNAELKINALVYNKVSLVFSWVEVFGNSALINTNPFFKECRKVPTNVSFNGHEMILVGNYIPTFSSVIVERSILSDVKLPLKRFYPWFDWWFWIGASSKTLFYCIPEELARWRFYPLSYGSSFNAKKGFWGIVRYELSFRKYVFDSMCSVKNTRYKEKLKVFYLLFIKGMAKRINLFLKRIMGVKK